MTKQRISKRPPSSQFFGGSGPDEHAQSLHKRAKDPTPSPRGAVDTMVLTDHSNNPALTHRRESPALAPHTAAAGLQAPASSHPMPTPTSTSTSTLHDGGMQQTYTQKLHQLVQGQVDLPYTERQELLRHSPTGKEATLTVQVFLRGALPTTAAERKEALRLRAGWVQERLVVQDKAQAAMYQQADTLHRRIELAKQTKLSSGDRTRDWQQPVLLFLRGNSGAGKTSLFRNPQLPEDMKALQIFPPDGEPMGAINPDEAKYLLLQADKQEGLVLTGNQVTFESSMVADRLFDALLSEKKNIVFDKRFLMPADLNVYLQRARASNTAYRVIVVDVDAELVDSLKTVAKRSIGGRDTNVPYDPIESGFQSARSNRLAVTDWCRQGSVEFLCFSRPMKDPENAKTPSEFIARQWPGEQLNIYSEALWHRAVVKPPIQNLQGLRRQYSHSLDSRSYETEQTF